MSKGRRKSRAPEEKTSPCLTDRFSTGCGAGGGQCRNMSAKRETEVETGSTNRDVTESPFKVYCVKSCCL